MLQMIKPIVERFPALAYTYRTLRDARIRQRQKAKLTPHGFRFMGHPEMESGTFEPEETLLIKKHLENKDVFVDIGANMGYYTCMARSLGKNTVSIEPLHQNLDYLYANLKENAWTNAEIFPVGLSDMPGIATLFGASTGASLVSGWAGSSPLLHRSIALSTLDTLIAHRFADKKLLIKIDVEGAEYALLKGAGLTLARTPSPAWMIEITLEGYHPDGHNPDFTKTFELFYHHGYRSYTANSQKQEIRIHDVKKWAENRLCDAGINNFVFERN